MNKKQEDFVDYKVIHALVGDTHHYVVTESNFYRTSSKEKMTDEEIIEKVKAEKAEVTRFEVINHASNSKSIGRLLTMYKEMGDFKEIELSYQDGGRTLKIFLR